MLHLGRLRLKQLAQPWHRRRLPLAELRSRPRLDSTLIAQSIVGSSVARRRPADLDGWSAIGAARVALQCATKARTTPALRRAPRDAVHSCWTRGFIDLLMLRPRGARSEPGAVLTGIRPDAELSERE